ncbi:hypothetical protein BDZ94DRAFT_1261490 [Collybia nuda]|uniref:Uncharacterized protein n=1 Tax=Collybia nuda TaxID=64659 RepID=A0A9P5Y4U8_9AGAR|nr:hypothetical protein BDZ94DRAFT_1261490 [Collybia nuda]
MDTEAYRHLNSRSDTLTGSVAGLSVLSQMTSVSAPFMSNRTPSIRMPPSPTSSQFPPSPTSSRMSPPRPVRMPSPPPPPSPVMRSSWKERRDTRIQQIQPDGTEGTAPDSSSEIIGRSRSNSVTSTIRRVRIELPNEPEPVLSRPDTVQPDSSSEVFSTRSRSNSTTSMRNSSSPKTNPFPLPVARESPLPDLSDAINKEFFKEPFFGRSSPMYPNHPHIENHRADKFYYI